LTVQELLSSSDGLGVRIPETVALCRLIEHTEQWTERVRTALANDNIARINQLITTGNLQQEKPANSESESTVPADESDQHSHCSQAASELGIEIIVIFM